MLSLLPDPLQQLLYLDRSSSGFHNQINGILDGEWYKEWVLQLQGDNLMGLVGYLDKVCCHVSFLCFLIKPSQVLDIFDPASSTFQKCLHELRHLCGSRRILPASYAILPSFLSIGHQPVASGGPGDIYEGMFGGLKVCVKRIRVYSKSSPTSTEATEVCYLVVFPASCC